MEEYIKLMQIIIRTYADHWRDCISVLRKDTYMPCDCGYDDLVKKLEKIKNELIR